MGILVVNEMLSVELGSTGPRRWHLGYGSAALGHHSHDDGMSDAVAAGLVDVVRQYVGAGLGWRSFCDDAPLHGLVAGYLANVPGALAMWGSAPFARKTGMCRAIACAPVPGTTLPMPPGV